MRSLTLRQIFQSLNNTNKIGEAISSEGLGLEIRIYIDEVVFYEGDSYIDFYMHLKDEYVEEFVNKVINMHWCGTDTQIFECRDTKHKIEVYIL